jgi:hypothetical protein
MVSLHFKLTADARPLELALTTRSKDSQRDDTSLNEYPILDLGPQATGLPLNPQGEQHWA